ncbi:alpha/beta fold hydrolase [Zhihengliuella halotolerans]|uniref:Pimeloyl-ACP methyl ester carboxylesterase n=1 Tax=Zhihengliuella halotolerans TaxID=370736 RepID=A0A4Q8AG11_9MICC|nr:alpha/beta hydrolase [Zhihengliuella halotolerans]RZU62781.1 pimeloyl-ACP methyl ester carboxylesterase [Zhihengliuella halotolerans]
MSHSLSGQPIVLLHGWPVTEAHWRNLLPPLHRAGFTPVPITLPGLGIPRGSAHSFRKSELADWLREELADRGIERFAVMGHDWGGTVAALLAAMMPSAVTALVIEEEVLPGITVDIPAPGDQHYPSWHGPFNRVVGVAEELVPGREASYYGPFLQQSAGPAGLDPDAVQSYVEAYAAAGVLEAGLGYYRTRAADIADVERIQKNPIQTPVLAIGGRYAMGPAVAEGLRPVATDVLEAVLEQSGHYPAEQEPEAAASVIVEFLQQHHRQPALNRAQPA